jgi:hypothetical protein
MTCRLPRIGVVLLVAAYALAMAYLESAVVVYLRQALGVSTGDVFPIDLESELSGTLGWIELGREAATLVMIGSVGWLVGRSGLERLAWAAVIFGICTSATTSGCGSSAAGPPAWPPGTCSSSSPSRGRVRCGRPWP